MRTLLLVMTTVVFSACVNAPVEPPSANLAAFQNYELTTFSKHQWPDVGKTHSADVVVHWPDGRVTKGLQAFVDGLQEIVVFAPDTRVSRQVTSLASKDWTSAVSVMEGTFTAPMPSRVGEPIAPTGQRFSLLISTVAHWNAKGLIDEQYSFWDNASFAQQLGIGLLGAPSSTNPVK